MSLRRLTVRRLEGRTGRDTVHLVAKQLVSNVYLLGQGRWPSRLHLHAEPNCTTVGGGDA